MSDPLARLRAMGDAVRAASPDPCPDTAAALSRLAMLLTPDVEPTQDQSRGWILPDTPTTYRTARWWCSACGAFVAGQYADCGKCRDRGPHHYGEEPPNAHGRGERRARLRAAHKRRGRTNR